MSPRRSPTLRAQMVGKKLKELREQAGLSLRDAGVDIGKDQSTLSRVEAGVLPPQDEDLPKLMNVYGVDNETERDALIRLSRDVWRRGWYDAYKDSMAEPAIDQAWLEARADRIRVFNATIVPGLLQIRDYAMALHHASGRGAGNEEIERWTEMRMMRKVVLTREDPVAYEAVLDETVLRRPVGGNDVMVRQLEHLLEQCERPNIELRVLPLSAGAHPAIVGSFELVELPEPYAPVGQIDTAANVMMYVESGQVEPLVAAYDGLRNQALGRRQSVSLIREAAKEFR